MNQAARPEFFFAQPLARPLSLITQSCFAIRVPEQPPSQHMASQWSWDAGGATEINYRPYSPSVASLLEAAWVPAQAAFSNEIVIDVPGGRARVYKHPRKGLIQERCDNANAWRAVRRVTATAVQNIDSVDLDDSDDEPPPIEMITVLFNSLLCCVSRGVRI